MADVGYVRVSSVEQKTDRQLDGVTVKKTFTDKASGGTKQRPALQQMIDYVREGDLIHVHSIDRLARDLRDLLDLLTSFNDAGVSVKFHKEGITFTGDDNPMQRMQMQIMGAVAEFERAIIKERQLEGIAKAKEKGVYKGRKRSVDRDLVREMHEQGKGPTEIAKAIGIARGHVYRILNEAA